VSVVTLDLMHRSPCMEGRLFGDVGPYQRLEGMDHFAVDPLHPCNAAITDIELAPRDATGTAGACSGADIRGQRLLARGRLIQGITALLMQEPAL
jgi:hypothetical protein